MNLGPQGIRSLVHRDHVHRSLYLDEEIFELEMKKIFGKTWVYVGHDSLVPKPGDYVNARVGRLPVVLSRHSDGKVYVIYNSCGHRGAVHVPWKLETTAGKRGRYVPCAIFTRINHPGAVVGNLAGGPAKIPVRRSATRERQLNDDS